MKKNPWIKEAKRWKKNTQEFILEKDSDAIEKFNNKFLDKKPEHKPYKIHEDLVPVPFLGNFKKAEVFFLQLNPGVEQPAGLKSTDLVAYKHFPGYKMDLLKNLRQEKMEYPFIDLNPKYILTGGSRYWRRVLSKVLSALIKNKEDYKRISKKICCLEYFPYHSEKFKKISEYFGPKKYLDTQKFNFGILKSVLGKKIIIMRGKDHWSAALREVGGDWNEEQIWELNSSQNVSITEKNLGKGQEGKDRFEAILKILRPTDE